MGLRLVGSVRGLDGVCGGGLVVVLESGALVEVDARAVLAIVAWFLFTAFVVKVWRKWLSDYYKRRRAIWRALHRDRKKRRDE